MDLTCVGITLTFIKYFEDYLDKNGVKRKGIIVIAAKKLTLWRDVENIKYAHELNIVFFNL